MKKMKKLIVTLITVALFIGLIPTAVFAEDSDLAVSSFAAAPAASDWTKAYEKEGKDLAGLSKSADISVIAQDGGQIRRTDTSGNQNVFPCGNGDWALSTWNFEAKADEGYRFVGWDTKVDWEFYDMSGWPWDWKWVSYSEQNPGNFGGHFQHKAGCAFSIAGKNIDINHVVCEQFPLHRNVKYIVTAKFEEIPQIPFTLTVNHVVTVNDQKGTFIRTEPYSSEPDLTVYKVGDKVKPSMFLLNTVAPYFTGPDDEVTLAAGANALTANYTKIERVAQPASLVVIHKGVSIDQFNNETEIILQTDAAIPSFDEDVIVNSANFVNQAGFEGYTYDSSRDVAKDLEPGENTISVYYIKEIHVNQKVDVIVNHIGLTYNSAGTVISETPIAPQEVISGVYYEGVTVQSGLFKKGATLSGYTYDATLDKTIVLALPDVETEENPNIINVYYVKKPAPYIPYYPYYPPTVVIEEEKTPLAPVVETIEEETTPLAQTPVPLTASPQTADSNASALLFAIVAIAGAGLFATKLVLKKDEE